MDDKKQPESNSKAHKQSLSRRSSCVKKKATELAVLCDASTCLIQFDQDAQVNTFPEDASEVNSILKRYLHVGEKVPEKRKVSGLTFQGGGDDMHGNGEGNPPSLGGELLDTKSALELHNFKHVLDVKIKKLEERIKLLKGMKSPEDKQNTSTLLQFYEDGTPFSLDDLQLGCKISGREASSKHDGIGLATSLPDQLSLSDHHMGLAANNVITAGGSFCSSGQPSTNCSSCDSGHVQKMNNTDSLESMATKGSMCQHHLTHDLSVAEGLNWQLKDDGRAEKKQKTAPFQLFYQDGMPCSSDDLQMNINVYGGSSPFFCDHNVLAVCPTNLLLSPFQSIEVETNVAKEASFSGNGREMDNAKEQNGLEDATANNCTGTHIR